MPAKGPSRAGLPWPELAAGEPGPLYAVFSEEDFLLNLALEEFAACPAFADNPSLNVERFHAEDAPPGKVLESARTFPFLGRRRLVMVLGCQDYKADKAAEFLPYLDDPAPTTTLVFLGSKLDVRTRFGKTLKKAARAQIFKKMYPQDLPPWLAERAAARGKRLSREAAGLLAELAGLGLGALDGEVEKLSLYVGRGEEITAAHVREVVTSGRLFTIFDFTDALARTDLYRALHSYQQLDALGEPPVKVLAMVQRMYRQLLEARAVVEQGGDAGEVQARLHTPPQATRTLISRARRETAEHLAGALAGILEADVALKSSPGSDRVIMERLIMDLCAAPDKGAGRNKTPSPGRRGGYWMPA
ncbi:MAG: DNA polymerase III subunit delta [Deltaproteobacteria bacterium]|nr:DNA polymerase III subunit delta [Deltaproteobacteria bacterium]